MGVHIEVISKETIKPSSPTPHHLQKCQLSLIDQIISPLNYPGLILFYESNPNITLSNVEKSDRLKASLSESLARFYPLAGRLVDNMFIDCNDAGITYIEAHASSNLFDAIHYHNVSELDKFLPREADYLYDNVVVAIQINFFDCGGLAIGIRNSHKIVDGFSSFMFLNSWAAATKRGHGVINTPPVFESAKHFPPSDRLCFQNIPVVTKKREEEEEKIVTEMFRFDNCTLEMLKTKFGGDGSSCVMEATRVEALTAFLHKRCEANMIITTTKPAATSYSVIHTVNIRNRMEPALSNSHFGNLFALAQVTGGEEEGGLGFVRKMRGVIRGIDGKYIAENLQQGDKYVDFVKGMYEGGLDSITFSSCCRMPVKEIDFGWGKPLSVALSSTPYKNCVTLMDNIYPGDGIEAWMTLEVQHMARLQVDKEFLSYVSSNMALF